MSFLWSCAGKRRNKSRNTDGNNKTEELASGSTKSLGGAPTPRVKRKFPEGLVPLHPVPSDLEQSMRIVLIPETPSIQQTPESIVEDAFSFIDDEENGTLGANPNPSLKDAEPISGARVVTEKEPLLKGRVRSKKLARHESSVSQSKRRAIKQRKDSSWSLSSQDLEDLLTRGLREDEMCDADDKVDLCTNYDDLWIDQFPMDIHERFRQYVQQGESETVKYLRSKDNCLRIMGNITVHDRSDSEKYPFAFKDPPHKLDDKLPETNIVWDDVKDTILEMINTRDAEFLKGLEALLGRSYACRDSSAKMVNDENSQKTAPNRVLPIEKENENVERSRFSVSKCLDQQFEPKISNQCAVTLVYVEEGTMNQDSAKLTALPLSTDACDTTSTETTTSSVCQDSRKLDSVSQPSVEAEVSTSNVCQDSQKLDAVSQRTVEDSTSIVCQDSTKLDAVSRPTVEDSTSIICQDSSKLDAVSRPTEAVEDSTSSFCQDSHTLDVVSQKLDAVSQPTVEAESSTSIGCADSPKPDGVVPPIETCEIGSPSLPTTNSNCEDLPV